MRGNCFAAWTMAQAMMCVNDAFDWPVRARWLLMTRRFSSSALTGMLRMEVAVGMVSDVSMFAAIFPAAPRSGVTLAGTAVGRAGAGAGAGVAGTAMAMSCSYSSSNCG